MSIRSIHYSRGELALASSGRKGDIGKMPDKDLTFSHFLAQFDQLGKGEWITVYASRGDALEEPLFYSALIREDMVAGSLAEPSWDLHIGDGRPGFCLHYVEGKQIASYYRYSDDGVEPLVLSRTFGGVRGGYLEVAEEFRLYFNLYEDRQNNRLILIDDDGDEEVVLLFDTEIKVKTRLIKEFLAAKKMRLALFFDESHFSEKGLAELGIEEYREIRKGEDFVFTIGAGHWSGISGDGYKSCGTLMGKKLIAADAEFKPALSPREGKQFVDFIIGVNEDGKPIIHTCDDERLANYFGKNTGSPHYLTLVFFKRDVLTKYYSQPAKYSVEDGFLRCTSLWGMRMDNNHPDYVMVFLGDLGRDLSYKEQLHWRSFNIASGKMSRSAFERGFLGKFADPENAALFLKQRFTTFQEKWEKKFGWKLFRPLSEGDDYHFKVLRIPLTNEQKEFDEQVMTLAKLFIDSLNEAELAKGLTFEKESPKGLDKLEAFLAAGGMEFPQMNEFLRKLQALRSTAAAHRKGEKYEKIKEYFSIGEKDLSRVLEDILIKLISTLNTLETNLLS